MKLQIAVSRASLIFQKRFPNAINTYGRLYIASTACTRSHIATTKRKIIISKIQKNCPLKSSYVAPRAKGFSIFNANNEDRSAQADLRLLLIQIQNNQNEPRHEKTKVLVSDLI